MWCIPLILNGLWATSIIFAIAACRTSGSGSSVANETPSSGANVTIDPVDPMFAGNRLTEGQWIKFSIKLSDPGTVHFQNSNTYPFHYDFISAELPGYVGREASEVDAVTLRNAGREVLLGAVILPPVQLNVNEMGIQFVGLDEIPREQIAEAYQTVLASITQNPDARKASYYMPTPAQRDLAEAQRSYFADQGIEVASAGRWSKGNQCYTGGWAIGRLKQVRREQIDDAYISGDLKATDILLTDEVPAEVPHVAGIVSLAPSTPNSHVALLAESFGVPFAFVHDPKLRQQLLENVGNEVGIDNGNEAGGHCQIAFRNFSGVMTPGARAFVKRLKQPEPADIATYQVPSWYARDTADLTKDDVVHVGGKAANFGILQRTIPSHTVPAIGLSFRVWRDLMGEGPSSLTAQIASILEVHGTNYPPQDLEALNRDLKSIRRMIKRAQFSEASKPAIIDALAPFDANRKIRFRSSTNAEDRSHFSGAGLYESFSGCLADDVAADGETADENAATSACDPEATAKKGVFRAIKKVFASLYRTNAYLARLRHGIDEPSVAMGLLVHHSFPDEIEMANGVVTMKVGFSNSGSIVSQPGALSVANPEGGAGPEEVAFYGFNNNFSISHVKGAETLPIGAKVLVSEPQGGEYRELLQEMARVAEQWKTTYQEPDEFTLDFEYKKIQPGRLIIKQVRAVPKAKQDLQQVYLLPTQEELCVRQGETNPLFASHYLKGRLQVSVHEGTYDSDGRGIRPFIKDVNFKYLAEDGRSLTLSGAIESLPGYFVDEDSRGFDLPQGDITTELSLKEGLRTRRGGLPVLAAQDTFIDIRGRYSEPRVPLSDVFNEQSNAPGDLARVNYVPCTFGKPLPEGSTEMTIVNERDGIRVEVSFMIPPTPPGVFAGYTPDLIDWNQTTITGLVEQPIVLKDYMSQSHEAGHHDPGFQFVFEPGLEPNMDQGVLTALREKNIRHIISRRGFPISSIGFDGEIEVLGQP